jgi:hypothetical protein
MVRYAGTIVTKVSEPQGRLSDQANLTLTGVASDANVRRIV